MIIGQTIVAVDLGSNEPTTVYSPWIASWGNSAIFAYEVLQLGGATPSLEVEVYTKNSESADPGTAAGTPSTATAIDVYTISDATNLLELVRLKVTLTPTEDSGITTAFVHFRILNPSWQTN